MKHLFIGGPADGRRLETDRERIAMEDVPRMSLARFDFDDATTRQPIKHCIYRREFIRTPNAEYYLFVPLDMSLDEAVARLFDGYASQRQEK